SQTKKDPGTASANSGSDCALADDCRCPLLIRRHLRRDPGGVVRDARCALALLSPQSAIRNPKLNSGGGGIRTHEGLRPAGFQDRSHQPLDHPSGCGRCLETHYSITPLLQLKMSTRRGSSGVMGNYLIPAK